MSAKKKPKPPADPIDHAINSVAPPNAGLRKKFRRILGYLSGSIILTILSYKVPPVRDMLIAIDESELMKGLGVHIPFSFRLPLTSIPVMIVSFVVCLMMYGSYEFTKTALKSFQMAARVRSVAGLRFIGQDSKEYNKILKTYARLLLANPDQLTTLKVDILAIGGKTLFYAKNSPLRELIRKAGGGVRILLACPEDRHNYLKSRYVRLNLNKDYKSFEEYKNEVAESIRGAKKLSGDTMGLISLKCFSGPYDWRLVLIRCTSNTRLNAAFVQTYIPIRHAAHSYNGVSYFLGQTREHSSSLMETYFSIFDSRWESINVGDSPTAVAEIANPAIGSHTPDEVGDE